MEITINSLQQDVLRLSKEVELLKRIMCEGELSDYAKEELAKSRNTPLALCFSHEDIKKKIFEK